MLDRDKQLCGSYLRPVRLKIELCILQWIVAVLVK